MTLKKIYSFIQGWVRYYMYYGDYRYSIYVGKKYGKKVLDKYLVNINDYNPNSFKNRFYYQYCKFIQHLLPSHIRQQIDIRIASSLPCILEGQCTICKCSTPAFQMADKPCDKPCYPAMLSKKDWEEFYGTGEHTPVKWYLDKSTNLEWTIFDKKFVHKEDYILNKFHKI